MFLHQIATKSILRHSAVNCSTF